MVSLSLLVTAAAGAPSAAAQPRIEQVAELYGDARFEQARELLERIERQDQLERDALIELLFMRALVLFALDDEEGMDESLSYLAAIEPGYVLPPEAPPSVRRRFDEQWQGNLPLRLDARIEREAGRVRLVTRAEGDPEPGLVRGRELACRVGDGPWVRARAKQLELPAHRSADVHCWGRLLGPGGATLVRTGSPDRPLTDAGRGPAAPSPRRAARSALDGSASAPAVGGVAVDDDDGIAAWPFAVGGAVVAVATAVTLAVMLPASGRVETVLEPPAGEQ